MRKRMVVAMSIGYGVIGLLAAASSETAPDLVPRQPCTAPNYWCTWYWQNYCVKAGEPVVNPSPKIYSNPAAREQMNEKNLLGSNGWARVMLPKSRGDFYFLIDHGWQDKTLRPNPFFTLVMDPRDFPSYAGLEPKERLRKLNEALRALGWRGLGLWVRGNVTHEQAERFVRWSRYAGIEYWKIDGGDTQAFWCEKVKQKLFPALTLEYVAPIGPVNPGWEIPGRQVYHSPYWEGFSKDPKNPYHSASKNCLKVLRHDVVFRTYDAVPLLFTTVTLQRVHDLLSRTAGHAEYRAILNVQDDCHTAAALGCLMAAKRHPLNGSRIYQGRDFHFQIAGDRHVEKRLAEIDRAVRWQRIAPPMPAGYGTYRASKTFLIDSFVFRPGDTFLQKTWGKKVSQSAPAVMARNLPLPSVTCTGEPPHVFASRFPNGAVCIATEGRVKPSNSWYHPRADIEVEIGDGRGPVGIFGYYRNLTLAVDRPIPAGTTVWAQDLLADRAVDVTDRVTIDGSRVTLPGKLIDSVGRSQNPPGDISAPGLVVKLAFPDP